MSSRPEQELHAIDCAADALAGAIAVGLCHRPPDSKTQALGRFGTNKQMLLPKTFTAFEVFNGSGNVTGENCEKVRDLALESLRDFYKITGVRITCINKTEPAFLVEKIEK